MYAFMYVSYIFENKMFVGLNLFHIYSDLVILKMSSGVAIKLKHFNWALYTLLIINH